LYRELAQHFPQAGKGRRHPDRHPAGLAGRIDSTEGRKAFVSGEFVDEDDTLLAEVHALMSLT
jgi:hypothetical protein